MISILMPIYNGIEFIDESVSSVLAQTYSNWELIIGVNGHPENSNVYQIANKYASLSGSKSGNEVSMNKIRVLDLHHIRGKSNALNAMIQYASYDYVALLDVDDIWLPNKLQVQQYYLHIYDVIGAMCVYFGDINGAGPNLPVGDISNFDFFQFNPLINSSAVIRKSLCYWNENGIEDYDMWLRLRKQGCKFYNCYETTVKHRIHKQSAFNAQGNSLKVDDLLKSHR